MRHLSAIAFILLLGVLPSCKLFKGSKDADILAAWQVRQDSIRVADSIRKAQDRLMTLENAKLDSAMNADVERLSQGSRYNIIVGSFITPEYAKGLEEVYRNLGYDARIVEMKGSRFELVSAESHESFRKAVTRLREFQDTVEINAWMYIIK